MSFLGFVRPDGSVGTRNHVGILSTVVCSNDVTTRIAGEVRGSVAYTHAHGCAQTPPDLERVTRTLVSLGRNPNLAGVLLVSLGCEGVDADEVLEGIAKSGRPVEKVVIQKAGAVEAVARGCHLARRMVSDASKLHREEYPNSEIRLGVKCGASDTTSGLASNPAIGAAFDMFIDEGASCVFGETTELMGAEHILARRASSPQVGKRIYEIVERLEGRVIAMGVDMRGGQPTRGNIEGGITTIEEKSLGAIAKGGSRAIRGVYEYGEVPEGKGLFIVDSPGMEPPAFTGIAAAGCQVALFSTGLGALHGFPFVPIIKVTANPDTFRRLEEHMDVYVDIHKSSSGIGEAAEAIYREVLEVASGKKTKAEIMGYVSATDIWTIGPII
jgi:altronate dehydratase large subunit